MCDPAYLSRIRYIEMDIEPSVEVPVVRDGLFPLAQRLRKMSPSFDKHTHTTYTAVTDSLVRCGDKRMC